MTFIRVNTNFDNTITEYSSTSISDIQGDELEASVSFVFPPSQPPYFYRYNDITFTVEENSNTNIENYETFINPNNEISESIDEIVSQLVNETGNTLNRLNSVETTVSGITGNTFVEINTFTGYTETNNNNINFISGTTDNITSKVNLNTSIITGLTASSEFNIVQTVRTTELNNVPTTWVDLDFDTTVHENNDSIIEHDNVNRDRILIKETGFYLIGYQFSADDESMGRVRVNDLTILSGSTARFGPVDDSVNLFGTASSNFIALLNSGDFISVQVMASTTAENIDIGANFYAVRLKGSKGEKGDTGVGSTIDIFSNGTLVSGSPFEGINFSGFTVSQNGNNAVVTSSSSKSPICQLIDSDGGQSLNDVAPNPIEWGEQDIINNSFFTHSIGESSITVLNDGEYELSYNINGDGGNNRIIVGVQFRLNTGSGFSVISPTLTASYIRNNNNDDSNNSLTPFTVNLNSGDILDVVAFRLGDSTACSSKAGSSFVKIKYIG